MKKSKGFTEAISQLESTIAEIEKGDLSLDELTAKVKDASKLVKACRQQLRSTEDILNKTLEDIN